MKSDELKEVENPIEWGLYYNKSEVDAAIAELKDAIHELKHSLELATNECCSISERAVKNERRLRRALYKACANWARSERYTEATWHGDEHREELWAKVQDKCRAKAEEHK